MIFKRLSFPVRFLRDVGLHIYYRIRETQTENKETKYYNELSNRYWEEAEKIKKI
jgi:hypothetical protein